MKDKIIQALNRASGIKDPNLEFSSKSEFGDYTTNIALHSKNPRKTAEELVLKLKKNQELKDVVDKIEIAGPGFINFHLSTKALITNLSQIIEEKENFGKVTVKKAKKIILEFTDPNPFKEFHIGHVYTNTVGESLSRILEANGAEVHRVNYQGDVGLHVAKSLWGMIKKMQEENLKIEDLEKRNLKERVKFMGEGYVLASNLYKENESIKKEINELNKKIFDQDKSILDIYNKGRSWSLEYFETIYKRLGTKFNNYYFESEVGKVGEKIVIENLETGVFQKSQGAIIFPGKKHGLHDRVFINSLGLPTYEAKELGLAPTKYKDFKYDQSIIITGNEINEYFKVLIKAMTIIYPDLGKKTIHIGHGMVRLPEGKMSSRTGNIITGEMLLDEVKNNAAEIDKDSSEALAVGAVKYAFLKVGIGQDIFLNIGESLSLQGNSGPYLQYTVARTNSLLAKSSKLNLKISNELKLNPEEQQVLRELVKFPEIIEFAAFNYSPNILCEYLFNLAQRYNGFYNKHKILEGDNIEFRLQLTFAANVVLKNGLNLLGIATPKKM